MSALGELGKMAATIASALVTGLIEDGVVSKADRLKAEKRAYDTLIARGDPKMLAAAYAAAKAKGPAK